MLSGYGEVAGTLSAGDGQVSVGVKAGESRTVPGLGYRYRHVAVGDWRDRHCRGGRRALGDRVGGRAEADGQETLGRGGGACGPCAIALVVLRPRLHLVRGVGGETADRRLGRCAA